MDNYNGDEYEMELEQREIDELRYDAQAEDWFNED